MCISKERGGTRFKDFKVLNQAMLAKHIIVDDDKWIPQEGLGGLVLVYEDLKKMRVLNLIDFDGNWDEELIISYFIKFAYVSIINIPLENPKSKDDIFWGSDPKDNFLVKSVYRIAIDGKDSFEASSSN
ncbi:retrotransposon protein, putative, unclassified [Cucumis melo var. makuwa]|uniref:Retrotransposon protein, putative, unclassified n=1 Tax=Cucumis melo var. makuwa TaxID=1194695 RepID=A0A5D3CC28_CUCMM|nr:retrotransposon protein, putative, unclassified [Cucumis melo var. makuwa]